MKLKYKNRDVDCRMAIGSDDKITFADQENKLLCFFYSDGRPMPNHTKYQIMNYLAYVLQQNDMLSVDTRVSFESD